KDESGQGHRENMQAARLLEAVYHRTGVCPLHRITWWNERHQSCGFSLLNIKAIHPFSTSFCPQVCSVLIDNCPAEVRPAEGCFTEVRPAEVCLAEVCLAEVCPAEVCLGRVCLDEECPAEVCPAEVCFGEVCPAEVCPAEVCLAEVCLPKVLP